MSFFEFSVCIIILNDDLNSGNGVSTTGVTRGGRRKNDRDPLISFGAVMFEEHSRYSQSLIYKLTVQYFSDSPLPHTHQFLFLYEGRYFLM